MPDPEEDEENTNMDYILHFLSFYWKGICALIPPANMWGGWASFVVSLCVIGLQTALVGDLAGMFGCIVGLKKSVTAITLIALGTSVPDTFASKMAAEADPYADASIGNITGSNSVNVFLGLGLPWVFAASYHMANGTTYEVPAGELGFSVAIFSACAVITIALIAYRRHKGGELGGAKNLKMASASFLVFLWTFYILMSSLKAYDHI
jgi:solute carrier family 8 (sodium/calcium exchanger)